MNKVQYKDKYFFEVVERQEAFRSSGSFSCQKSWDKPIGDIQLSPPEMSQIHVIIARYLI